MNNAPVHDADDVIEDYIDEPDEPSPDDYAGGSTPTTLSLPDEAPRVAITNELATAIRQEIDRERKFYNDLGKTVVKVNPNVSGSVQFSRYSVPIIQAVQICREKRERGNIVITVHSEAISIGLHAGIMPLGTDTVTVDGAVVGGDVRVIRTRLALWAVSNSAINSADIDVQEEFD
ncbi:MAG: hypothetical protein MN733_19375 [Nitrososphaera sp.]|nr:hypothetical protein [Nitrososphaera sp.]